MSTAHLPRPGQHFVGREDELAILDNGWSNSKTNIVEFVAFGGVGKSALVSEWLKRMQVDEYRGAERVFGHSFYSQGSREDAQASADSFLDSALRFFGESEEEAQKGSPWQKGERLARLVRQQPTLLILDGVEPLQSPGRLSDAGQVRDPGLQALVVELAGNMNGLVVISTRARVQDISGWEGTSVVSHELDHLSEQAGSTLLVEIGVQGTEEELAEAVREVDGHALSITLVGKYVVFAASGHIEDRREIGLHEMGQTLAPEAGQRRNPARTSQTFDRIMQRYEVWLSGLRDGEGDVEVSGRLALEIVRLTGLFDRPITAGEFAALVKGVTIQPPRVPTLFEELADDGRDEQATSMAFVQMIEQATPEEKLKIVEAAKANNSEALGVLSQSIAEREGSSSGHAAEAVTLSGSIPGLTDLASEAREDEVTLAIGRLVEYGLITKVAGSRIRLSVPSWPDPAASEVVLDAHPLVREYFRIRLEAIGAGEEAEADASGRLTPDAYRLAHRRLYGHLKQSAPDRPDNLSDMMPLYHAVAHGCKAGLSVACYELYRRRIRRGNMFFSSKQLGAFSLDLSALSCFFDEIWDKPSGSLSPPTQAFILGNTSVRLRALSRLREAIGLQENAVTRCAQLGMWIDAATGVLNMSGISLALGDVLSAVYQGDMCVELADRSGDAFSRLFCRTRLAYVLFRAGLTRREGDWKSEPPNSNDLPAYIAFREAEAMQQEWQPTHPLLYAAQGCNYCELILDDICQRIRNLPEWNSSVYDEHGGHSVPASELQSEIESLRNRAGTILRYLHDFKNIGIVDFGLSHLMLGRTWLTEAEFLIKRNGFSRGAEPSDAAGEVSISLTQATTCLNDSVSLLRQSGHSGELPCGLLHRAALWRACLGLGSLAVGVREDVKSPEDFLALAENDLSEAETMAERGSMLIHQIEAALERTRLYLMLAQSCASVDSVSPCFKNSPEGSTEAQRVQREWLAMAREKLDETKALVKQSEKPYEPYEPMDEIWEDHPDGETWDPPSYIGVFKKGDIVGYHCHNDEIAILEKQISELENP